MAAPIVYLDPNMMGGILLYGFAAALVGGIDNPWGAVLGGFIVGVLENVAGAYVVGTELMITVETSRPAAARHYAGLSLRTWRIAGIAALLAAACVLPFSLSSYHLFQATQVLVYAIVLLGLNMLTGFNGQISLGHGAFYAIGVYTAAILLDKTGMPYWATIPFAGLVCLVAGFLFGTPALRLEGPYLALATFALAVSTPQILKYKHLESWTGGVQGIIISKPDAPAGLPLDSDQWLYFFCL